MDALGQVLEKHGIQRALCGAGCGDGWVPLIDRLITDLIALGWDRELHQIKEKFGGLRFYVGCATQEVFDRIDKAEEDSFRICEECGEPGKPTNKGWIKTLCKPCTIKVRLRRL